jgi:anti-sigma B factor antagonist
MPPNPPPHKEMGGRFPCLPPVTRPMLSDLPSSFNLSFPIRKEEAPSMKFSSRLVGDVVVYDLKGGLEGGPDTFAIKDDVKKQMEQGHRKFLLNMDGVDYVSSTGVGIVVSVYSSIMSGGGAMKISNANQRVSRVMMITKLLEVFDSYYKEEEAIQAFQSA